MGFFWIFIFSENYHKSMTCFYEGAGSEFKYFRILDMTRLSLEHEGHEIIKM